MGKIRTKPFITEAQLAGAANAYGIPLAAIKAVKQVETPCGAFDENDFPVTLFEGQKFHAFTGGIYDSKYPSISYPVWDRTKYRTGPAEAARLALAVGLDRDAAMRSASWGMFQVMGFNYEACGCKTIQDFVNMQCDSEAAQLDLFCRFLKSQNLIRFLILEKWSEFASRYNGPAYAANKYDVKLAAAFKQYSV